MLATMFKMPFATTHFNVNQRVWVIYGTGSLAVYCVGRFRGKGRYVKAWVRWESKAKPEPQFHTVDVSDDFAARHGLSGHVSYSTRPASPHPGTGAR